MEIGRMIRKSSDGSSTAILPTQVPVVYYDSLYHNLRGVIHWSHSQRQYLTTLEIYWRIPDCLTSLIVVLDLQSPDKIVFMKIALLFALVNNKNTDTQTIDIEHYELSYIIATSTDPHQLRCYGLARLFS